MSSFSKIVTSVLAGVMMVAVAGTAMAGESGSGATRLRLGQARRADSARLSVVSGVPGGVAEAAPSGFFWRSLTGIWRNLMLDPIRAISHSLRTRLLAAALLLPLIALATATSGVGLRCRITGEALSA